MDEDFANACSWLSGSSAASALSNETKLELYGLYKYINTGAGPTGTRPSIFSFEGRAKYDAWARAAQEYDDRVCAKSRYVEIAESAGWRRDAPAEQVDGKTNSKKSGTGMGVSVSVMALENDGDSTESPVHTAAACGDVDALRILLIDTALVNAKDEFGYTPLHVATDRERLEAVRYLVSLGADKSALDQDGQTALDISQLLNNEEISALLR